jgi:hypothetical protein
MDDIERLPSITARRTFQGCVLAGLAQLQFVTRGRHSRAWQLPYGQGTFLFLTTRRMMADVHGKTDRCKTQQERSLRSGTLKSHLEELDRLPAPVDSIFQAGFELHLIIIPPASFQILHCYQY